MNDVTTLGELFGGDAVGNRDKVKPFESWYGKDQYLTRQEYIDRWVSLTNQMSYMFSKYNMSADLLDFQLKLTEIAGNEWDKH